MSLYILGACVLVVLSGLAGVALLVAGAFLSNDRALGVLGDDGAPLDAASDADDAGPDVPVVRRAHGGRDDFERQARALRRLKS